jgi:SAM-dependent methyltransferase
MERSLLIGCGNNHAKQVQHDGKAEWAGVLTKLDMNPNCGADIVLDMAEFSWAAGMPVEFLDNGYARRRPSRLPFDDDTFDEIGAYNCLEHWGQQGDWRGWFVEMAEYHRILKPGGTMSILVPIGADALADPGHTRFFQQNYFGFLSQEFYDRNKIVGSCFTDYRWFYKKNFDVLYMQEHDGHHLAVVLRKA